MLSFSPFPVRHPGADPGIFNTLLTRLVLPLADLAECPLAVIDPAVSLGLDALVAARLPRGVLAHLVV